MKRSLHAPIRPRVLLNTGGCPKGSRTHQILSLQRLGSAVNFNLVPRDVVQVAQHLGLLTVHHLARFGLEAVDPDHGPRLEHQLAGGPQVLGAERLDLPGNVDPCLPAPIDAVVAHDLRALPVQGLRALQAGHRDPTADRQRGPRPGLTRLGDVLFEGGLVQRREHLFGIVVSGGLVGLVHAFCEPLEQIQAGPPPQPLQGGVLAFQTSPHQEVKSAIREGVAILPDEIVGAGPEVWPERPQQLRPRPPRVAQLHSLGWLTLVARQSPVSEDAAVGEEELLTIHQHRSVVRGGQPRDAEQLRGGQLHPVRGKAARGLVVGLLRQIPRRHAAFQQCVPHPGRCAASAAAVPRQGPPGRPQHVLQCRSSEERPASPPMTRIALGHGRALQRKRAGRPLP
mmetsp:Transcript_50257/g.132856  ORF Transcript_50257/g.132856 Transcript_50257/m.132856 type:complete len:397 (+) Transcript_50257:150-1340(+)